MNEMQVFLVSEIGEICIGTVQEIINFMCDNLTNRFKMNLLFMDLVGDIISREDGSLSSKITVELRDPTGE